MTIPQTRNPIVHLLVDARDGATVHGATIKLKQNDAATIGAAYDALVGIPAGPNNNPPAIPGLIDLLGDAKALKHKTTAALRSVTSNGRALAMAVVNSLKPVLGQKWNGAWNEVGFQNGSLEVPEDPTPLLQAMRTFYTKNPAREVKDMNGLAFTADACQAAADAIIKADTESKEANASVGETQKNLQQGIENARTVLMGLQNELGQLLAKDDPRWVAFGFDMPGHHGSPAVPRNLTATPGAAAGSLFVHCDDARRADSYRFQVLDAADGKTVIAELLVHEPEAMFEHLTSGANVKVVASAHNATGDSQPGNPVTVVVP